MTRNEYEALIEIRDMHADALSLADCLLADDALEDAGMSPDDRETCHPCQAWADDHTHGMA